MTKAVSKRSERWLKDFIRIRRCVWGQDDEDIAAELGWRISQLRRFAVERQLHRRKGPALSDARRQWAELEFRVGNDEHQQAKVLARINAWLARRPAQRAARTG